MRRSWFRAILCAPVCITALSVLSLANSFRTIQAVTAEQTLRLAGDYLQQYERAIQGLVVQEDYLQTVVSRAGATGAGSRRLRSDLLVLNSQRFGWIALRDVFDVDGRPVRDREERLSRLFAQAVTPDSLRQARSLAAEGSRFNLNAPGVVVDRTINTPMVALMFLRTSEQPRSSFRRGKTGQIDGRPYVTLDFSERAKPALIGSNAEATTEGTFWIDAEAGRVLQSELRVESVLGTRLLVKARIKVRYARVAKLDLWLPDSMDEQYELDPSRQLITGRAIYSNFRQFAVTTSEGAK
jgi:hypothetical protein